MRKAIFTVIVVLLFYISLNFAVTVGDINEHVVLYASFDTNCTGDNSVYENHGTGTGTLTHHNDGATVNTKGSCEFANNAYVTISHHDRYKMPHKNFTYAYWVNISGNPGVVSYKATGDDYVYNWGSRGGLGICSSNEEDFGTRKTGGGEIHACGNVITAQGWKFIVHTFNTTDKCTYEDGVKVGCSTNSDDPTNNNANLILSHTTYDMLGKIDEFIYSNDTWVQEEIDFMWNNGYGRSLILGYGAPNISNINCTSCNIPNGDTTQPYTTSDATPTFGFDTDVEAYCAIGNQDQNYSTMGSSRNCTIGEGGLYHQCTLTSQDELIPQTDYVYISCSNTRNGNETTNSTSGLLEMNITNLISNIFCKSCNDSTEPYTTSDTTPTFNFTTDMNASCRIGDEDLNYTDMGDTRNCTTTGNTTHTCTLTVQDELTTSTDYIYISCRNSEGVESNLTKATLLMDITDLEVNASKAIDDGIQSSVIWPGATVYSDQQVYLRNLNDTQVLATVDRVAVYGSQRWLLNVVIDEEPELGLFNITPAVYVLEMANKSLTEIEDQVSTYINLTKN